VTHPHDPTEDGAAPTGAASAAADDDTDRDTTGVDNWLEEGGPLEPQDLSAVESEVAHQGGPDGAEDSGEPADPLAVAQAALAERTLDLQRLQAEYANYRKRVDRDRQLVAENATYAALTPIIEVLDTIDRAREHDELEGGFQSVAEQLERVVAAQGLVRFGAPGDAFDPTVHEALSHIGEDAEVEVTTCKVIAKAGYKIGDRVVRAAQVLVVDPAA
jgi:molecular chaperone GrpE